MTPAYDGGLALSRLGRGGMHRGFHEGIKRGPRNGGFEADTGVKVIRPHNVANIPFSI